MQPTCEDPTSFGHVHLLRAFPDLDGDGRREVWVDDTGDACEGWLFPLPSNGGTYVPADDPDARYGGARFPAVIGDQTGDGLPDAWTGWDQRVYAAPVTFGDGTMTSSAVVAADGDLSSLLPIPFDLDADGLTDFVGLDTEIDASEVHTSVGAPIDPETGEVLVVVPSASLASPSFATAWDIAGRSFTDRGVFLEDGTVSVLVIGLNEVVVIDLGAGTRP